MGINFKMEPLDCEPFFHEYDERCSDADLTIGIWRLPLMDLKGNKVDIPFHITKGNGILLLGNAVLSKSVNNNPEHLLHIPAGAIEGLRTEIDLPTYTTEDEDIRTHLHVVPCRVKKFRNYFMSCQTLHGTQRKTHEPRRGSPRFMGKTAKDFARRLHLYSHLPLRDMKSLCNRGGILQPILSQALEAAVEKCTSCKTTGRPLNVQTTSLKKPLQTINEEVQLDYMWITELTPKPMLHMKDNSTGFSATALTDSRDQDEAPRTFETQWITVHGPPVCVGYDPEYHNEDFGAVPKRYNIITKPRPARKHSKIGSVESGNRTLRVLEIRMLKDAIHQRDTKGIPFTPQEILARATLACNVLRANKKLSPFEIAKEYMPAIGGFRKFPVDQEIANTHLEQITRRALTKISKGRIPHTLCHTLLEPKAKVYFFEKKVKQAVWNRGFVQEAKGHFVELTRSKYGHGKRLKVAYEDIRLFPSSSLLQELDEAELDKEGELRYVSMEEEKDSHGNTPPHPDPPPNQELLNTHFTSVRDDIILDKKRLKQVKSQDVGENDASATEEKGDNKPPSSILRATSTENPQKDIGDTPMLPADKIPDELESQEQEVLRHIRSVIGDEPVTKARLRFAPRWVIDKAIQKEKNNFIEKNAFEVVNIRSLPKGANLITSHCFFQIKFDGESGKLKLKFRLVPHGNRDKEKDNIRKDSATAQFPVIRALLSAAAILRLRLGTIDISGAYLPAGTLQREVYVRLSSGWSPNKFVVWKLLVPAYGLVESRRLWQLAVEEWMKDNDVLPVHGMPQTFTLCDRNGKILLIIVKVVDDFLIAGKPQHIKKFHTDISKRFKVGRFLCDTDLIFNRLHISEDKDGSVTVSMKEYMDTIEKISLDRVRRKQQEDKCTPEELKMLQALAGQLNWLGHGVLPSSTYLSSLFQQWTGDIRVRHLMEANRALHEIRKLQPILRYEAQSQPKKAAYFAFSDASSGKTSYGQTGYVSGIFFEASSVYHVIDWHSSKQCRVSFSSIGAEILAAAESADRASLMSFCLNELFGSDSPLPLVLTVGSYGLYSTISTLHEGRDYRLTPTLARMRDSFETAENATLMWTKGVNNLADALTKQNKDSYRKLNETCINGKIASYLLEGTERVTDRQQ